MNADDHRFLQESIGLYVIHRLEDADRVAIEQHLISCAACRAEETQLRGIIEMLDHFDGRVTARRPFAVSDTHAHWLQRRRICRGHRLHER